MDLARLPVPEPGPGEVVVAVDLATVCGSDLHTVAGHRRAPCPSVLGHEGVGRVVAVGAGGRPDQRGAPVREGQRVVWSVTVACGTCDRCAAGRTAKCRSLAKVGHEPVDGPWPLSGTYATHLLLPAGTAIVAVPDGVPDALAAPAGCAVATVVACLEAAGPVGGRSVVVSGLGMLGLVACWLAASAGAEVEGHDPVPARRARAAAAGAVRVLDPGDDRHRALSADVVLELSGAPSAVAAALERADVGGTVVLAGSVSPAGTVSLDPEQLVRRLVTITGVHNYEPRHLATAVDALVDAPEALLDAVAPPVGLDGLARLLTEPAGSLRSSVAPGAGSPPPTTRTP